MISVREFSWWAVWFVIVLSVSIFLAQKTFGLPFWLAGLIGFASGRIGAAIADWWVERDKSKTQGR
jgi:hypothetical protein